MLKLVDTSFTLLEQHSKRVSDDPEAMKWVAYYSNLERWSKALSDSRRALTLTDETNPDIPLGFVELTLRGDRSQASIDYCIFNFARGKGNGNAMIRAVHNWVETNTSVRNLMAYVDSQNTPSVKLLERAGYLDHGKIAWGLHLYTYVLN